LSVQWRYLVFGTWPAEFLFGQTLVIEHKTVVFPEQEFDLVTTAIGAGVLTTIKRVMAQFLLVDSG